MNFKLNLKICVLYFCYIYLYFVRAGNPFAQSPAPFTLIHHATRRPGHSFRNSSVDISADDASLSPINSAIFYSRNYRTQAIFFEDSEDSYDNTFGLV